jgi:MOSC domain-containing protein YiiM
MWLTAQEANRRGHPDENHAAFALKDGRVLLTCARDHLDEQRFPLIHCPVIVVCDFGSGSSNEMRQTFGCLRIMFNLPQFFDKWTKIDAKRELWTEYCRFLKTPIPMATVGALGITGDEHRYKDHGGRRKALLLLAAETIDALRAEGWPVYYGALGENLTTRGLDHRSWRPGLRYRVGSVLLELTTPRQPCAKLNPYGKGIQARIWEPRVEHLDMTSQYWGLSGFYTAVLVPGAIAKDDIVETIEVT